MDQNSRNTTTMAASGKPRVIRKVVNFHADPNNPNIPNSRRRSQPGLAAKDFNRHTDGDIFKLGDAFKSGEVNIDEFIKNMTESGYKVQKVESSTNTDPDDPSLTKTITRVTTVPDDQFEKFPDSSGHVIYPSIGKTTKPSTGYTDFKDQNRSEGFGVPNEKTSLLEPPRPPQSMTEPPRPHSSSPFPRDLDTEAILSNSIPKAKQKTWKTKYNRVPKFPQEIDVELKAKLLEDDEDVPLVTTSDEEIVTLNYVSCCPTIAEDRNKRRIQKIRHGQYREAGKGKLGMTASEVTIPGEEEKLPAIHQMVLNYKRLLEIDREGFAETLFRAVKLNGVDVVKILCGLAIRKGIKLSSIEMREPESSATILHVALLYDHVEIVEYLIDLKDRSLIMATYTKEEYNNQTALHVAVANGNVHLVNRLLNALRRPDRKILMNTVATGTYFKTHHPDGQLCLTASAWSGNGLMLATLAQHGANFALSDLQGNTLLHRIVIGSGQTPDKMDYRVMIDEVIEAVGEWAKHCKYKTLITDQRLMEEKQKQVSTFQKLLNKQNHDGHSPLTLAASLGSGLLIYLMNMDKIFKIPQTKLGSISWVTYDVTDVTTFANDYYNKFSVLHILAHNSGKLSSTGRMHENDGAGILDAEPVKTLIANKWKVYRWVYIGWCLFHVFYITAFTYCTYEEHSLSLLDEEKQRGVPSYYPDSQRYFTPVNKYLCGFIILPIVYIILEFVDWFGTFPYSICYMQKQSPFTKIAKRLQSEWVITGNGPYRFVCLGYSIASIIWFIFYVQRNSYQDMALSMAMLLGWVFVLFFTRGCRVTSRFSIMIQKMFFRDLLYFLAVYVVILIAFSFSLCAMYNYLNETHGTLNLVLYQMMNIITDLEERQPFPKTRHPLFATMILIIYAIVAVILLMNMLIAMMNTSYEIVRSTQCNLWKQQQLSIMLMLERRLLWLKPLCRRSEANVWQKEWEDEVRSYLDVTL